MQVQVARWGNSLGQRIPKDVAQRTWLREGARVDVQAEADRIVISPARPRYVLADLLRGMTPEGMRQAFDWGPDRGGEVIEEGEALRSRGGRPRLDRFRSPRRPRAER